jgi:pyridoxamine 5'-phosphate oxidase
MDLGELRRNYSQAELHENKVQKNPMDQFSIWFKEALESKIDEPNAMNLATVDDEMQPSIRTVLLKYVDSKGFVFYTNYESRKAIEIEANPKVGAHFLWLPLERQICIRGTVERVSKAESFKYFISRPRGSQLGAWVSQQSSIISSKSLLYAQLEKMKRKFGDGEIPLPDFWGGYRIIPHKIEFWQGGSDRLHDRILYLKRSGSDEWILERLSP